MYEHEQCQSWKVNISELCTSEISTVHNSTQNTLIEHTQLWWLPLVTLLMRWGVLYRNTSYPHVRAKVFIFIIHFKNPVAPCSSCCWHKTRVSVIIGLFYKLGCCNKVALLAFIRTNFACGFCASGSPLSEHLCVSRNTEVFADQFVPVNETHWFIYRALLTYSNST